MFYFYGDKMKLSNRLQACADLVQRGNVAADVGTDHGYLAIHLLEEGICPHVYASDLREGPLTAARRSAARTAVADRITFCLSDGLQNLPVSELGTVICAGMGADTIISILEAAPQVRDPAVQLILQPQSRVHALRRYLGESGFSILQERLSRDGKFLYTALDVRFGGGHAFSPGEQFFPRVLRESGDPLLPDYQDRVIRGLRQSIDGLRRARVPDLPLLHYYETALNELSEEAQT